MTTDRWTRIGALFEQALDVAPAGRDAFVREGAGGDEALAREVLALLEEDAHTHGLLDGVALDHSTVVLPDSLVGQTVGAYRVLSELGRGGGGTVYLAERADGVFEQRVALKVIRRGFASDDARRRFRAERRILARLDHPNIARLFDGGLTADGRPYFVMELVEGQPIDAFCDARRLTVDERLDLFVTVCRTVLYAHRRLIVHRDLKPDNILVADGLPRTRSGGEDGRPVVKLLDFGIAKVLADDEGDASGDGAPLTREGFRVMTPEYASPEQVRGELVGTASDIYSLGVVLYELLAGHRPYALTGRSPAEVERVVCDTEPPRPSTVVERAPSEDRPPAAVSDARRTEPRRLRRRLAGDLDTVVLKALRKEPDRRYASAAEFADDLHRHRTGLPVSARPDTVGYRLRKFAGRHRAGVTAAAGGLALIAGLVGFYTVQLRQERDRAQTEAAKATQVSDLLIGMFEAAEPGQARGDTVTVRAVLDRAAPEVRAALAEQPEVRATMLHALGEVYRNLQLHDAAMPLAREAVALRRELGAGARADLVESLNLLARFHFLNAHYDSSLATYEEALVLHRADANAAPLTRAELLNNLALVHDQSGDPVQAQALLRESIAIKRAVPDVPPEELAPSLYNLGFHAQWESQYDEAEALFREARTLFREAHGDDHPSTVYATLALGSALAYQEQFAEAEPLVREGLALTKRVMGPASIDAAYATDDLGRLYREMGDFDRAIAAQQDAIALLAPHFPDDHPNALYLREGLAITYFKAGRYADAERIYRRTLDARRARFEGPHKDVSAALGNLGQVLKAQGRLDEAQALYEEALTMDLALYGEQHRETAVSLHNLALIEAERGNYAAAEPVLRRTLAAQRALFDGAHDHTASTLAGLAEALAALDRPAEARPYVEEALAMRTELHGANDERTQRVAAQRAALEE